MFDNAILYYILSLSEGISEISFKRFPVYFLLPSQLNLDNSTVEVVIIKFQSRFGERFAQVFSMATSNDFVSSKASYLYPKA